MSTGTGLVSTLHPNASIGQWIGYQIIFAAGCGMSIEQCNIAAQAALSARLIPAGTSVIIVIRALGGSVGSALGQTIFERQLRRYLAKTLQNLPADLISDSSVINLADKVRNPSGGDEAAIRIVLNVYSKATNDSFYLAAALGAVTLSCALGVEWKNVKTQEQTKDEESQS